MLAKKLNRLSPTNLRILLIASMFLVILASVGIFWLFREQLTVYANQVQADNSAATTSANDVIKLQNIKKALDEDKVAVTRAAKIVADTQFYQYQDQIITDLTSYAKESGVVIQKFDFNGNAAAGGAVAGLPTAGTVTVPGVKSVGVAVTMTSPITYQSLMKFIHAIEANLTKMQLAGVSMTWDQSKGLTANTLTVKVFTR